jgi:hypothetical protein
MTNSSACVSTRESWRQSLKRIFFSASTAWPLWVGVLLVLFLVISPWLLAGSVPFVFIEAYYASFAGFLLWFLIVFWLSRIMATSPSISSHDWTAVILIFAIAVGVVVFFGYSYFHHSGLNENTVGKLYYATAAFFGNGMFDNCQANDSVCSANRMVNIMLSTVGYLHSTLGLAVLLLWLRDSNK